MDWFAGCAAVLIVLCRYLAHFLLTLGLFILVVNMLALIVWLCGGRPYPGIWWEGFIPIAIGATIVALPLFFWRERKEPAVSEQQLQRILARRRRRGKGPPH